MLMHKGAEKARKQDEKKQAGNDFHSCPQTHVGPGPRGPPGPGEENFYLMPMCDKRPHRALEHNVIHSICVQHGGDYHRANIRYLNGWYHAEWMSGCVYVNGNDVFPGNIIRVDVGDIIQLSPAWRTSASMQWLVASVDHLKRCGRGW